MSAQNPYKAPSETEPPLQRRSVKRLKAAFWLMTLLGSGLYWVSGIGMFVAMLLGSYDPRVDDRVPAEDFGRWCASAIAAWLLSGAIAVLAVIKIRRRPG